ncbi:unnamed protein product, partial [Urochloa humidicola]
MDYLDLHRNYESGYGISYDLPRMCHVTTNDFNHIVDV